MPRLLSGSTLRRGGSGEFLDLRGAMPQLPQSPSTTTGFTLITNSVLQTRYASSLGNIEFNQSRVYSNLENGIIYVESTGTTSAAISTGTATLVVNGGIAVGRNIWVEEDIVVNGLTIGQGYEGINNIVVRGNAIPQENDFLNGQENIAIGYDALKGIETGYKNIAIGRYALASGTNLSNSIAIGDGSLRNIGSTITNFQSVVANKTVTAGIEILNIAQENPARVTTVASHGLSTGTQIYINNVSGFDYGVSLVNEKRFWVDILTPTEILLYQTDDLSTALNGLTATVYVSSGTVYIPVSVETASEYYFNSGDQITILSPTEIGVFYAKEVSTTTFDLYYDNNLYVPVLDDISIEVGSIVSRNLDRKNNIGVGVDTGKNLIDGAQNIFFGHKAAASLITGSNNIIIGHETGKYVYTGSGIISIGGDNIRNGVNNQVNIGSVFYFDGEGNTDLNTDVTLGLGSDSTGTDTGALVVVGGVGIAGNLYLGGSANFLTSTTFFGDILPSGPGVNIGSPTNRFANLYLDGTTLHLNTVTLKSYNSLDFSIESTAGFVTQTVGNLYLNSGVTSTNATTGALVVDGGVGISQDLYIDGSLKIIDSSKVFLNPADDVEIQPSGTGNVLIFPPGTLSRMDNVPIGTLAPSSGAFTEVTVTTTTNSISTTSGALTVTGGVGIQGNVYSGTGNPDEDFLLYTPKITISPGVPPPYPRIGDFWIDATVPAYLQYIKDGTSTFWIQVGAV